MRRHERSTGLFRRNSLRQVRPEESQESARQMSTQTKPMSAVMLVSCLAGEFFTHPAIMVEAIKEDEEALAIVRQYGKGLATYEEVKAKVSQIV